MREAGKTADFPKQTGAWKCKRKILCTLLCNLISSYPEVESNNSFVILTTLMHRANFLLLLDLLLQQLSHETDSKWHKVTLSLLEVWTPYSNSSLVQTLFRQGTCTTICWASFLHPPHLVSTEKPWVTALTLGFVSACPFWLNATHLPTTKPCVIWQSISFAAKLSKQMG